jgi:hypothetical protein
MLHIKRIYLTFLSLLAFTLGFGQAANSPFSSFGVGDIWNNALAQNQAMGGLGISNPSSWYINNQNPALLVNNYVTVFQAGMLVESRTLRDGSSSINNVKGNLNYLVIAFPVKPGKWTTSMGLTPYSSVNYKLSAVEPVAGSATSTVLTAEVGTGGINQFYWANGIKVHKNLALGIRANYLFGSITTTNTNTLTVSDNRPIIYFPLIEERNYVKDFNVSTGIYFHKDSVFKKNYRFNIGLIYDFQSTLSTKRTVRIEKVSISGSVVDSTTLISNEPGSIILPQTIGAGISFGVPNRWTIGGDFSVLDYEAFKGFKGKSNSASTGFKSSAGFEWVPDPTGASGFLGRLTYRTGVSYDLHPYLVGGNQVKDFGVNFGLSLPVARLSTIDFSFKIGKRGSITENTIEENYFKLYLGMTFNDNWFIKRKFD